MADVIFSPIFRGTVYKHHLCSECGYKLHVGQSIWGGVMFDDTSAVKFCPGCGNPIIRFSDKAVFEEVIDFEPMWPFYELHEEYERKAEWLYHCYISKKRQERINEMLPFAQSQPESGWVRIACDVLETAKRYKFDNRKRKKLLGEFGTDSEDKKEE